MVTYASYHLDVYAGAHLQRAYVGVDMVAADGRGGAAAREPAQSVAEYSTVSLYQIHGCMRVRGGKFRIRT